MLFDLPQGQRSVGADAAIRVVQGTDQGGNAVFARGAQVSQRLGRVAAHRNERGGERLGQQGRGALRPPVRCGPGPRPPRRGRIPARGDWPAPCPAARRPPPPPAPVPPGHRPHTSGRACPGRPDAASTPRPSCLARPPAARPARRQARPSETECKLQSPRPPQRDLECLPHFALCILHFALSFFACGHGRATKPAAPRCGLISLPRASRPGRRARGS